MNFSIDTELIAQAQAKLSGHRHVYWIVGGAGSGKSTICRALSERFGIPVYDMDAQVYGAYHSRFSPKRHPVNSAWSASENGLSWLLSMTWPQFNHFNQAALAEYLDLLAQDLSGMAPDVELLIDGGISNPALAAQVIPAHQMVCLENPGLSGAQVWEGSEPRLAMKSMVGALEEPSNAWARFLDFDAHITETIHKECLATGIPIIMWQPSDAVAIVAARAAEMLGIRLSTGEIS